MNRDEIRAKAFNGVLKTAEIANLKDFMPDWVEADPTNGQDVNQVMLREVTGAETKMISDDKASSIPKLLALALITRDKQQVFEITEIGSILEFGNSVINPLAEQALALSGMTASALPDAKNG